MSLRKWLRRTLKDRKQAPKCPFCKCRFGQLDYHIRMAHMPAPRRYCTVCQKIEEAHTPIPVSPPYTIPCEGGRFIV